VISAMLHIAQGRRRACGGCDDPQVRPRRRLGVIAIIAGVALVAAASGIAASPAATKVVYVAPVNAQGRQLPSITVLVATKGSCEPGSDSVPGPVYRCFNDYNNVLDPCWAARGLILETSHRSVLCMSYPWVPYVVRLDTSGLPASTQAVPKSLSFPWGVKLANGENCLAAQGAHDNYKGRVVDYYCGRTFHLVLLRGIHQSSEPWTFDSAIWNGKSYSPGAPQAVRTAWYGGPAPRE
jgi:hypothetical protein